MKVDEIKQVVLETILPQNIAEYYMKFKSTEVGVDVRLGAILPASYLASSISWHLHSIVHRPSLCVTFSAVPWLTSRR